MALNWLACTRHRTSLAYAACCRPHAKRCLVCRTASPAQWLGYRPSTPVFSARHRPIAAQPGGVLRVRSSAFRPHARRGHRASDRGERSRSTARDRSDPVPRRPLLNTQQHQEVQCRRQNRHATQPAAIQSHAGRRAESDRRAPTGESCWSRGKSRTPRSHARQAGRAAVHDGSRGLTQSLTDRLAREEEHDAHRPRTARLRSARLLGADLLAPAVAR